MCRLYYLAKKHDAACCLKCCRRHIATWCVIFFFSELDWRSELLDCTSLTKVSCVNPMWVLSKLASLSMHYYARWNAGQGQLSRPTFPTSVSLLWVHLKEVQRRLDVFAKKSMWKLAKTHELHVQRQQISAGLTTRKACPKMCITQCPVLLVSMVLWYHL